ncbi:MAG: hypothetical protein GXO22_08545 [Aquificae bacterium]|nr:hypothetical protein [Aquificota bacterium]
MKFLKNLIFHNFHLKLLSLIVAFLMWLNVTSQKQTHLEIYSYIDVINLREDLEIEAIEPERVKIILESTAKNIQELDISKIHVFIDGSKLKEGENKLPVKVAVEGLEHIKIITISPPEVIVYARKKH